MREQEEADDGVSIDVSHLADMPTEEFQRFVQRMNPALRVVLERHRAKLGGEPDSSSFNSFIEPGL
ncbi:hypothetical protein [Streptomyces canus]|uniref:FXSXX-COOH protein n=1 Tax=Streptomyces canus TaxID=58343 RepID=A0AAW8F672_9ACTN|nr:hypothetical protein [Streptomyces canus]MDQ0904751.1 hypothetical protein [Streptomyces canus]MDQ1065258.1 hypothetical protein [Streptomyces canus]